MSAYKNKEKRLAYVRAWRDKNRDKLREQDRAWKKKNRTRILLQVAKRYKNNPQKTLDRIRFKKYGISGEEFRAIIKEQKGRCPICRQIEKKNLSIDHNHSTGKVRGIICNRCNMALGNVQDSPKILRALADYLEKHYG